MVRDVPDPFPLEGDEYFIVFELHVVLNIRLSRFTIQSKDTTSSFFITFATTFPEMV